MLRILPLLCALMLLSACGTIRSHGAEEAAQQGCLAYSGVAYSYRKMGEAQAQLEEGEQGIVPTLWALDLPFSLLTDTLMLLVTLPPCFE